MIKMIRYIFISLLTLTLSCANTSPEPAGTAGEGTELAAGTAISASAATTAATATSSATSSEAVPPQNKNYARLPKAERQAIDSTLKAENIQKNTAREAAKLAAARAAEKATADQAAAEILAQNAATEALSAAENATAAAATTAASATESASELAASGYASEDGISIALIPEVPVVATTATTTTAAAEEKKPRFLPTTRPRIDREIDKIKYIYKGEFIFGLTASYGTVSSDDTDILLILENINADATMATVKPFVGYFYRDNNCIGIRFGYRHMDGSLTSAEFDLGESNDASFDIPQFSLNSNNYSVGLFHRSYAGLDPKGRFGLFAEFELSASMGHSKFKRWQDNAWRHVNSDNIQVKLAFNPGFSVFIFPNVCAGVSFGLGGIQYTKVNQHDQNGKWIGSREASSMRFRLNLAAINFGMTVHLWDKKKQ